MADGDKKPSEVEPDRARELLSAERTRVEAALAEHGRERSSQLSELDTEQSGGDDAETLVEEQVGDAVAVPAGSGSEPPRSIQPPAKARITIAAAVMSRVALNRSLRGRPTASRRARASPAP